MAPGFQASGPSLLVPRLLESTHHLPSTKAERELDEILRIYAHDLDIGLVSWIVATDIPEFADLTIHCPIRYFD
jgi:hypothetical protein